MKVVPRPGQEPHIEFLSETLKTSFVAIDNSEMGEGKTHFASALCQRHGFENMVVLAPKAVQTKWISVGKLYGLPLHDVITYQTLASRRGNQPSHGLLNRYDVDGDVEYEVTEALKKLIASGCLLVADEFHNMKNENTYQKAFRTLCTYVSQNTGISRILLLSGTPFDKTEQIFRLFYTLGIMESSKLYTMQHGQFVASGILEIIEFARQYDEDAVAALCQEMPPTSKDGATELCVRLYTDLIEHQISSSIVSAPRGIARNYMCKTDQSIWPQIEAALNMLKSATRYEEETGTTTQKRVDWPEYTRGMIQLQKLKVDAAVRLARRYLGQGRKVVCYSNYNEPIDDMAAKLHEFKPLVLTGRVPAGAQREAIISKFQAPNFLHRVLISNPSVGGEGIDLDDTDGRFPRAVVYMPDHSIIRSQQTRRRFDRRDTKSEPVFNVLYFQGGLLERAIFDNLARKSEIMKRTLQYHTRAGIKFPCDFESVDES